MKTLDEETPHHEEDVRSSNWGGDGPHSEYPSSLRFPSVPFGSLRFPSVPGVVPKPTWDIHMGFSWKNSMDLTGRRHGLASSKKKEN